MLKPPKNTIDAEAIGIRALGFIASDPERLGQFLAITGIGPGTLRTAAAEPGFLAQVLEFISHDDSQLMAFAANIGIPSHSIAAARQKLSGNINGE